MGLDEAQQALDQASGRVACCGPAGGMETNAEEKPESFSIKQRRIGSVERRCDDFSGERLQDGVKVGFISLAATQQVNDPTPLRQPAGYVKKEAGAPPPGAR